MTVSEQVHYESRVRGRFGVLAFAAALLLVVSQLLQIAGPKAAIDELTLDLIIANKRVVEDIVGALLDMLGLISVGMLLAWLHRSAALRKPEMQRYVLWVTVVGAGLSAVMAVTYTILVATRAHDFVTSGTQGYPEADHLTTGGLLIVLPLLLQLGTLMLTIGTIWTCLNAMRVGLLTRPIGYAGIIGGALFLFPIGVLVPVVQGFWLAGVAVILVRRWPSGDPPAWDAGVAVPWLPSAQQQQMMEDRRAQRAARGQRRRVSDADVFDAVSGEPSKNGQGTGTTKRKRKRR